MPTEPFRQLAFADAVPLSTPAGRTGFYRHMKDGLDAREMDFAHVDAAERFVAAIEPRLPS